MLEKESRLIAPLAFAAALGTAGLPIAAAFAAAPVDGYQARLRIWALMETLNADLLASRSATKTLTDWCAAHGMAANPKIVARLQRGATKPISPAQRQRLGIGPTEPVVYRRVDLVCGTHILSQADNWYVPSRLTPAMNAALQSTNVPFGRAVAPLDIRRQTIAVNFLWRPLPPGWEMAAPHIDPKQALVIPPVLFEHRAVVLAGSGAPIALVDEFYRADILDFPSLEKGAPHE